MIDVLFAAIEDENQRNELAEFYSKYKERFCHIANSKLNDPIDAEDTVQVENSQNLTSPR